MRHFWSADQGGRSQNLSMLAEHFFQSMFGQQLILLSPVPVPLPGGEPEPSTAAQFSSELDQLACFSNYSCPLLRAPAKIDPGFIIKGTRYAKTRVGRNVMFTTSFNFFNPPPPSSGKKQVSH